MTGSSGLVSSAVQQRFCEIAASLHQSRLDQGLTLVEVAQRSSLSPVVIQAMEECDFKNLPETWPNGVCLQRYADALGLRGGDLVKGLTRRASAR
ncbi:MAG: helix-turn-helix transcriptional regulator [Leptolyngbya sp.]|nr:helix-turn-helix transcriptional regulator [Leptolyngbya sp.]